MTGSFSKLLNQLQDIAFRYDEQSNSDKKLYLDELSHSKLPRNHLLGKYNDLLIFLSAHPPNPAIELLAKTERNRIATLLKRMSDSSRSRWNNSGLPYTRIISNFSYDLVYWMNNNDIPVQLDSFDEQGGQFKKILRCTLPDIEQEATAIADENLELLQELRIDKRNILAFLLAEFKRLKDHPVIRDYLFDELKLVFRIQLKNPLHSKLFNAFPVERIFYHDQLLKKFDHLKLLNEAIQDAIPMNANSLKEIIRIIKMKLILLQRETEPVSYMDEKSLRYYELERGISIAFFTMIPERQLPVESYVGYTLFKNGYPAAYGGAWILGKRALFGINIFDWFRGGESGYILCQLLRCYRQIFSINYFEIEPYQFGLGNPEGIESGAFWFYYKFGFRPLNKALDKLAFKEQLKRASQQDYKTDNATLERFTESNLALQLGNTIPWAMWQIRNRITAMIHKRFHDDRSLAESECIRIFMQKSFFKRSLDKHQLKVMTDFALMSEAFQWTSDNIYRIMEQLVLEKPKDVYSYQKQLLKLTPYIQ